MTGHWLSADAVIETVWPDEPSHAYSDTPAPLPCPGCDEGFYAQEWLERHLRAFPRHRPLEHGTRGMYRQGCDCDPCMTAARDYWTRNNRYRAMKRKAKREATA